MKQRIINIVAEVLKVAKLAKYIVSIIKTLADLLS